MLRAFLKNDLVTPIDPLIDAVREEMHHVGVNSDEYSTLLSYLERLYKVKEEQRPAPLSRDTMALVAGNLAGILLIIAYEQKHVITSKGFNQIIRPRAT